MAIPDSWSVKFEYCGCWSHFLASRFIIRQLGILENNFEISLEEENDPD
jgi:hypothetical protein